MSASKYNPGCPCCSSSPYCEASSCAIPTALTFTLFPPAPGVSPLWPGYLGGVFGQPSTYPSAFTLVSSLPSALAGLIGGFVETQCFSLTLPQPGDSYWVYLSGPISVPTMPGAWATSFGPLPLEGWNYYGYMWIDRSGFSGAGCAVSITGVYVPPVASGPCLGPHAPLTVTAYGGGTTYTASIGDFGTSSNTCSPFSISNFALDGGVAEPALLTG